MKPMPRSYRNDYDDIRLDDLRAPGPKPHSGLGLASLLIAIGMGLLLLVLLGIAAVMADEQGGEFNDNDPAGMAVVLGIVGCLGITVVGLVLGVVGCFQSDRSIILPILGSIFNGLILVGVMFIGLLGILLG